MFAGRLSGVREDSTPSDPVPGEFVLFPTSKRIEVNGQEARPWDFVVCDAEGVCQVDGLKVTHDRAACLPEEAEAVDRLGAEVVAFSHELNWAGLLSAGVVDPGWEEELGRHPLEQAIKEYLPYLRNVFHRPIRHLRIDTESVLTAKARRIALRAPDHLAAHPEDWDGRTVLGVKPKRVLAKVRYEEMDIYENRLAARLVDHLSLFLARRIRRLREIVGMLTAVGDFGRQLRGSHWLQNRVSRTWGDAAQSSRHLHKATELVKQLTRLRTQLLGLMDADLYEKIPRRARIAGQIRITNILRNDANYRYVALLWQRWFALAGERAETEDEYYLKMQRLHDRHAQVTTMYVARALAQLGFTELNRDADLLQADNEVVVTRENEPRMSLSLRYREDRTLVVQIAEEPVIHIVPMFFGFLDLMTERMATACIETLSARARKGVPCIAVFPGNVSSGRSTLPESAQNRLLFSSTGFRSQKGTFRFLPVSPYDITSVERLARCLKWFIMSRHFMRYPYHLPEKSLRILEQHGFRAGAEKALISADRGFCIKRIDEAEALARETASKCRELAGEIAAGEGAIARLEGAKQGRHHDPSWRGLVRATSEKVRKAKAAIDELEPLRNDLQAAISYTNSLMTCPCCDHASIGTANAVLRTNYTFGVKCPGCECAWGLAICGECHERFPYIRIDGIEGSMGSTNELGWEEMSIGQDMLAVPRVRNGGVVFECPWCGHV